MLNILKGIGLAFILGLVTIIIAIYLDYNFAMRDFMYSVPYGDKFAHFFLMGIFAFFANVLLDLRKVKLPIGAVLMGSLCVFTFVSIDECFQFFVAHRNCELLDFACNYAGIFVIGGLSQYVKLGNQQVATT